MSCLEIRLFGGLELTKDGESLAPFPTKDAELIFSFLVLNRRRLFAREHLVGLFYGSQSESLGRKHLRNALWRVRRIIESDGIAAGSCITTHRRQIGFSPTCDYWLDVHEFEKSITSLPHDTTGQLTPGQVEQLRDAVSLYRGNLLDGVYEDWCLVQQERFKLILLGAIQRLMNSAAEYSDWNSAIQFAKQLLSFDILREHIHRELMRFFYRLGDRPAALEQYRCCAQVLKTELDIEPMQQTRALRDAIQAEKPVAVVERLLGHEYEPEETGSGAPQSLASHGNGLQHLQDAAALLLQAHTSLQNAMLSLEARPDREIRRVPPSDKR